MREASSLRGPESVWDKLCKWTGKWDGVKLQDMTGKWSGKLSKLTSKKFGLKHTLLPPLDLMGEMACMLQIQFFQKFCTRQRWRGVIVVRLMVLQISILIYYFRVYKTIYKVQICFLVSERKNTQKYSYVKKMMVNKLFPSINKPSNYLSNH